MEDMRFFHQQDTGKISCDPNAKPHGKRPLNARRLQRKQTTRKSVNTMRACETRGSRSRTDANLSNFLM